MQCKHAQVVLNRDSKRVCSTCGLILGSVRYHRFQPIYSATVADCEIVKSSTHKRKRQQLLTLHELKKCLKLYIPEKHDLYARKILGIVKTKTIDTNCLAIGALYLLKGGVTHSGKVIYSPDKYLQSKLNKKPSNALKRKITKGKNFILSHLRKQNAEE